MSESIFQAQVTIQSLTYFRRRAAARARNPARFRVGDIRLIFFRDRGTQLNQILGEHRIISGAPLLVRFRFQIRCFVLLL